MGPSKWLQRAAKQWAQVCGPPVHKFLCKPVLILQKFSPNFPQNCTKGPLISLAPCGQWPNSTGGAWEAATRLAAFLEVAHCLSEEVLALDGSSMGAGQAKIWHDSGRCKELQLEAGRA